MEGMDEKSREELLEEYARLIVRMGVNLQTDQPLVINAPLACADFARRVAGAAYDAGAHDVTVAWNDERLARLRYDKAKKSVFTEFPEWRRRLYEDSAAEGAAFVTIHAADPEIFSGVEPERLTLAQQAAGAALLEYRQRLMSNKNAWCVVSIPTESWAKKVFPEDASDAAVENLWQAIFAAVRLAPGEDAAVRWQKHIEFLARAAKFMNDHAFSRLEYKNGLGTNLSIELPEGHIWMGGAEKTQDGVTFVANMPTEEIYTLPKRDGVNGTVKATRLLNVNGNLVEGFSLTFKDGKVVDYKAERGAEILKELFSTDEGASYLGEVALVPYDSPISKSGVLFFNTLFDENAACHLAFGKAYPTCIEGGEKMTSVELLQRGVNDSLVHEDFMVGSRDLAIYGIEADGTRVPVFREGNFAFV